MKKRVTRQIEELLFREEYVVVPGLGTFLRHILPAEVDEAKGLIYPPKNALSFNGDLSQSDGMLTRSYVGRYGISRKKAEALIHEDVQDLLHSLRASGMIRLGSLGRLWLNGDRKIEFAPDANHPYTTYFFGYAPVVKLSGKAKSEIVTSEIPEKRPKDTVYLPINLSLLKYGAAAAVVILALFLLPSVFPDTGLPAADAPRAEAGFMSGQKSSPETTPATEPAAKAEAEQTEAPVSADESSTLFGLPLTHAASDNATPKYYVVVATLRSEKAVEKYLTETGVASAFPSAGIITTKGAASGTTTYRIYTSATADEAAARAELRSLVRDHDGYADAWIFTN